MSASERDRILDRAWLAASSLRTTAVLAIVLALCAAAAALVPQGSAALEVARATEGELIRDLAAWGLTDIFGSAWIRALGWLLLTNIVCVVIRARRSGSAPLAEIVRPPSRPPHKVELEAPLPERAAECLREVFRGMLGAPPVVEEVAGSRVTMVFDTSPGARIAPLLAHLGLVLLVMGAGLAAAPPPRERSLVRAILEVKDSRTGTSGVFDMVEGESFQFFQWRPRYTVRDYVASKDGLGPAVRIEEALRDEQQIDGFWVYLNAPAGFDERHRKGFVSIRALRLDLDPLPGAGLASSPASVLLTLGIGLLLFGALASSRPEGRLWIEADGDKVEIAAVPARAEDSSFAASFERWALVARGALEA